MPKFVLPMLLVPIAAIAGIVGINLVHNSRSPLDTMSAQSSGPGAQPTDKALLSRLNALAVGQMKAFKPNEVLVPVPKFTFKDASGTPRSMAHFKGKVVLLNLWGTWCAPCLHEMPTLDRLQAALGSDKFEVVALSIDSRGAEASQKMLDKLKATNLKMYVDETAKIGRPLAVVGMPTTLLIDEHGREIGRLMGPAIWDSNEAKRLIQAVLPAPQASNNAPRDKYKELATGEMKDFQFKPVPIGLPSLRFKDSSGADVTPADFKGKVILLNLWATWCAPCLHEMPTLDRLQAELGADNFEVVALSVDRLGAPASQKVFDKLKVANLKLYVDKTARINRQLGSIAMPTSLLIDEKGRELGRLTGWANWDSSEAKRLIRAVLPAPAAGD